MVNIKKLQNKIATGYWMDVLGIVIVLILSGLSGYFTEMLNATPLFKTTPWAAFVPFGIISTLSSIASLESTRFTGRLSKIGNYIGIVQVVVAGLIDAALGNQGAWLSYPVSFFIYAYAIKYWSKMKSTHVTKIAQKNKRNFILIAVALVLSSFGFSFLVNYLGWGLNSSNLTNNLFWLTTLAFALSLCGNLFNAVKLTVQWQFWGLYNCVQLIKSIVQVNFANTGKYIYYIINAIACHTFWSEHK